MEGLPLHKQSLHKFLTQERYSAKNTSFEISSQPPSEFWCAIVIVNWVTSFASWNVRILRTNWSEAHYSQDGGWRPERQTDCKCLAPSPRQCGCSDKRSIPTGKRRCWKTWTIPAPVFSLQSCFLIPRHSKTILMTPTSLYYLRSQNLLFPLYLFVCSCLTVFLFK